MKKVIFSMIAVVVMALAFVSCGNSGNNGANKEKGIVGSWYYNDNTFYTFNDDGTGSYTVYGNLYGNFTYTESDGKLTLKYESLTEPSVFNYKVEGKTLTILSGESNIGSDTEYKRK